MQPRAGGELIHRKRFPLPFREVIIASPEAVGNLKRTHPNPTGRNQQKHVRARIA